MFRLARMLGLVYLLAAASAQAERREIQQNPARVQELK